MSGLRALYLGSKRLGVAALAEDLAIAAEENEISCVVVVGDAKGKGNRRRSFVKRGRRHFSAKLMLSRPFWHCNVVCVFVEVYLCCVCVVLCVLCVLCALCVLRVCVIDAACR